MKQKLLKAIACLSLVMMVFSAMAPGAFADDTGTASDVDNMKDGQRGGPGMDRAQAREAMEFDSDEEELEFVVEKTTEHINNRIEKLNEMLENIDDIENENITEESIEEKVAELEALLKDIEDAETLDDFKATMEEARDSMMPDMKENGKSMMENRPEKGERPAIEEMEFESDEEEMEFIVEKATESINHRIEKLNEMLENIDDIENEDITEESIEEKTTELEALLKDIESVETLDDLKEIMKEARENNPRPRGQMRGHGPMGPGPELAEEVTEE